MVREVTLRYGKFEKTYPIEADSHYTARMEALTRFLEEFKIPGRPVEYLTKKKGLIEITVRSEVDRRTIPRDGPSPLFYVEQTIKFKRWVREGDLPKSKKTAAVKLLLQLEEVFGSA